MSILMALPRALGRRLAHYLSKSLPSYQRLDSVAVSHMAGVLQKGDILLVEGNSRISVAIKYLTQSSWSHAALYVGETGADPDTPSLLEADLEDGVRLVSLAQFAELNVRVCRAPGLSEEERMAVVEFACAKLGHQYDLKNIFDLLRYLIQKPAVPNRFRRAMLGIGSGEPTRAICSTLIAEAFQHVGYPILPLQGADIGNDGQPPRLYQRHFTHFTPRDFDLSPYFTIIKPTLELGFDHRQVKLLRCDRGPQSDADPRSDDACEKFQSELK